MSSKKSLLLVSVALGVVVMVSGCGPSAKLALQFAPSSSDAYDVTTEVTKDFRFEQPTAGKLRQEQTTTLTRVGFTQTIQSVDEDGIATAEVTIDSLSLYMTNKNEERLSFDSTREADRNNPLYGLVGQRYTVQLSPKGKVVGVESSAARRAVVGGVEARLAERIVNEEGIRERHEITPLQGFGAPVALRQSWSKTVASPPGLLAPKNYQKVYTFTGLDTKNGQKVAVVEMNASESAETVDSTVSQGMGIFAKMFDSHDEYTGKLLLDVQTGKVLDYNETFICTYLAHEMPANAPADMGPDTLTMRFTHRISVQKR